MTGIPQKRLRRRTNQSCERKKNFETIQKRLRYLLLGFFSFRLGKSDLNLLRYEYFIQGGKLCHTHKPDAKHIALLNPIK